MVSHLRNLPAPAPHRAAASWPERFLHDPWGSLAELADLAMSAAPGWGLRLLTVAASLIGGVVAARWGWRRWRHHRLAAGARLVQILPPPQVEPAAAEALWGNLAGLLRLRRPLDPRPHVSFELTWTTAGVSIGLWVPGTVAPRLVERAVEAGWPGARTTTTRPDHPARPAADGMALMGGELRLAAGPWPPLRTEHWVDPLRALLGGGRGARRGRDRHRPGAGPPGRPATTGPRHPGRLRPGRHPHDAGQPGRGAAGPAHPGSRRGLRRSVGPADPQAALAARAALAKVAGPCWEVRVRYGVSGPAGLRGRLRARAHAIAAAFAVYNGRNRLSRRRLWRPAPTLASRTLQHSDLLAAGELVSCIRDCAF